MKQINSCQYDSQSTMARCRFSDIHTDGSALSVSTTDAMNSASGRGRRPRCVTSHNSHASTRKPIAMFSPAMEKGMKRASSRNPL
jgi:hypothetical protein